MSRALLIDAAIGFPLVALISMVATLPMNEVGVRSHVTWMRLPPSPLGETVAET